MLTKNRVKLLKLFYANPDRAFYMQEIGRALGKKPGVFQRTLNKMEKQGILTSEYKANARFFKANTNYSVYKELKSIVSKAGKIASILIFAIYALASQISSAEEPDRVPMILSIDDAIGIAVSGNKQIQIQEKEMVAAKAGITDATSTFLPHVSANYQLEYNDSVAEIPAAGHSKKDARIFTGYKTDNQLGLTATESIFKGGANIATLKQAKINLDIQKETLRAAMLEVEFETKRLFYGLLLAYETKRIAEDLVYQAQAHYEEVLAMFNNGTASRFDVLQSKVQVSRLLPQLVNAKNAIELIKVDFKKLLSINMKEPIEAEGELASPEVKIEEADFLQEAYINQPQMRLKVLGVDMNKWAISFEKAEWLPQVDGFWNLNYRSNMLKNIMDSEHTNWNVGLKASLLVFDGFSTAAKVAEARARYEKAKLARENTADQVVVDVKSACLNLVEAKTLIDAERDTIVEAREALRLANVRYDNGVGINLDVLDAQVALAQVRQNLSQALYDYVMAKAALDKAMGREFLKEARK